MRIAFGVVLTVAGLAIMAWGVGLVVDYRKSAQRYWTSVFAWHHRHNPFWGSGPTPTPRAMRFLRPFGGSMTALIGLIWTCCGSGLLTGYLK